jgi:plastocyanin domain-containing protein
MRITVVMIALAVLVTACSGADESDVAPPEDVQVVPATDGLQIVQVTVEGSAYRFAPASVQAGMPVRLVFDPSNLRGCSRSVTLPAYDIEKTIEEGDATIDFTPEEEGPIAVACTMNMFTGTLLAE